MSAWTAYVLGIVTGEAVTLLVAFFASGLRGRRGSAR